MPHRYDLQALGLDFLELLTRFLPTEYERSLITRFEQEQRPIEELSEEDRFMLRFSRIPRLPERMNTLIFLGNFPDTAQLLMPVCAGRQGGAAWAGLGRRQLVAWAPREHLGLGWGGVSHLLPPQLTMPPPSRPQQLNAVIAASMSIKSSDRLRQILEVRAWGRGLGGRGPPLTPCLFWVV